MIPICRPARLVLAAILALSLVAGVAPIRSTEAAAAGPEQLLNLPMRKVRILTGLVGLFGAWNARNRIYRDARIVQGEQNAHFDGLRDVARKQLHETDGFKIYDALHQTKATTYLRLVENIENRRAFATELIETEKSGARTAFHRTVRDTLTTALIQSKGGRQLLGRVQESLNDFAERIGEVRTALERGSPDLALDRLAARVTDIPQLREQLKILGGEAAAALDRQLNGLLTKANSIREGGVGAVDEALAAVNAMSAELQVQVDADRRARSSSDEGANAVEISVPTGGGNEASADAIAAALTKLVLEHDPTFAPADRPQMRQRVRDSIMHDTLERSREIRAALGRPVVTCKAESESVYIAVMATLGRASTIPKGEAQFFVCYLKPEDNPIYAFIVEAEKAEEEEEEEEDAPWDEESTTTTTIPPVEEVTLAIPPGTYAGAFDEAWSRVAEIAWYASSTVNEISIAVDDDGNVTGQTTLHFAGDGAHLGCPAYDRFTFVIDREQNIGSDLPTRLQTTDRFEWMRAGSGDDFMDCDSETVDVETGTGVMLLTSYDAGVIIGRVDGWEEPLFRLTLSESQ